MVICAESYLTADDGTEGVKLENALLIRDATAMPLISAPRSKTPSRRPERQVRSGTCAVRTQGTRNRDTVELAGQVPAVDLRQSGSRVSQQALASGVMVPVSNVLAFAVTVLVIIAIPGPSVLFTISRALTVGRRATLFTVAGNAVGVSVQVVSVAVGMGALVAASATAFTVVKYALAPVPCISLTSVYKRSDTVTP